MVAAAAPTLLLPGPGLCLLCGSRFTAGATAIAVIWFLPSVRAEGTCVAALVRGCHSLQCGCATFEGPCLTARAALLPLITVQLGSS